MRAVRWLSDDGKFEGQVEEDVAAYEARQKNVLAWLGLPWSEDVQFAPDGKAAQRIMNMTPKWLALFQLNDQLLNDGDMGKWKQRMIIELDDLQGEFMEAVREPVQRVGWEDGALSGPIDIGAANYRDAESEIVAEAEL